MFRINYVTSITCVKRLNRCMKRIAMESAELNSLLRGVRPIERAIGQRKDALERRATGRKQTSSSLVVRGAVRMVASVASHLHSFSGVELCPNDLTRWRALRSELDHHHEARSMQYRFRKLSERYLAVLEDKLIKERLPP
jgi:hypothetical protein